MWDKAAIILIGCLLVLVIGFMPELLPLVDAVGLEATVTFVVYYLRSSIQIAWFKIQQIWRGIVDTFHLLTYSLLLEPRNYVIHASTSVVVLVLTGSTALAFSIWLPLFIFSGSGMAF